MCVEGLRQMGRVWYLSLNIMRRERASVILGPIWWEETQCPLIQEGSFPSSKIKRCQCIQLSLDRDDVWGGGWREKHSAALACCLWSDVKSNCHSLYQCWTHEGSVNYFITVAVRLQFLVLFLKYVRYCSASIVICKIIFIWIQSLD